MTGYSIEEFERMMAQDDFVLLSEWDSVRGRMRMMCELDPNAWFHSGCLIEEVQERLENTPEMPFGAYRLCMRAGRGAYTALKTALPNHMAGAVEPGRMARSNEFHITFKQDSRRTYYASKEDVADFEEPLDVDEVMAGHLRRMREQGDTRMHRSDSARIRGRMRITSPWVEPPPAHNTAMGIFLLAALAIILGLALFVREPEVHHMLASMF
jgi:hypothetical protein